MKSKGGTHRPKRGATICIISMWLKCLAFSSIVVVCMQEQEQQEIFLQKNVSAFRSDAKVIIF